MNRRKCLLGCLLFLTGSLGLAQTSIKILGDSVSVGVGASDPSKRYSTLLATALGVEEINSSVSGGALTDKSYVEHMFDHWETTFLTGDPDDYALLFLGINDTDWIQLHPEQGEVFAQRLDTIASGLLHYGYDPSRIIFCAPYYVGGLEPARTTIWNAYADTCERYGIVFADFWAHANTKGWRSTYLKEGPHPNDPGHQLLCDWVLEAVANHSSAPLVRITAPVEGEQFLFGEPVAWVAEVVHGVAVFEVRFYVNDELLEIDTSAPYECSWTPAALGAYTLRVVAENGGGETGEDAVEVTIVDGFAPDIFIADPASEFFHYASEAVTVVAEASDRDGTVEGVLFYLDQELYSTDTVAPFEVTLADLAVGVHTFFARAIDDDGKPGDSAALNFTTLPSPTDGVVAAINCGGGGAYVSKAGIAFSADQNFTGGDTRAKEQEVNLTDDDVVFHTYRIYSFDYEIPVANGLYDVTLMTFEPYWGAVGSRVFNIDVEGNRKYTDLDLFALYGKLNATELVISGVEVSDGFLTVSCDPSGVLAGIVVREVEETPTPWELWRAAHPAIASAPLDSDDDADGIPLLWEYAFDLDPEAADVASALFEFTAGNSPTFSFPRDPRKSDLRYIVETSPDLANWTVRFGPEDRDIPNNAGSRHQVTANLSSPSLFFRLRLELVE